MSNMDKKMMFPADGQTVNREHRSSSQPAQQIPAKRKHYYFINAFTTIISRPDVLTIRYDPAEAETTRVSA